jgi:hypothetical protein
MFLATHALAGIIISQHVHSIPEAFGLGVLSHYALDMIPHGDENLGTWVKEKFLRRFPMTFLTDMSFLLLFIVTVRVKNEWPLPHVALAAILGAMLPDLIWSGYDLYRNFLMAHFPNARRVIQKVTRVESFFEHHERLHRWFHTRIERRITMKVGLALQAILAGGLLYLSVHP